MTNKPITAGELRIGNYLQDAGGKLCVVDKIESDFFYAYEILNFKIVMPFKAIPLTPEWLKIFRFKKDKDYKDTWHNEIALYRADEETGGFNYNVNFFEHSNLMNIQYVHQLQNLYFALTQSELQKIK